MASTLQPSNKSTDNTIPAELLSAQSGSSRFWRDKTLGGVSPAGDWQAWSRHLAKRRSPKSLQRLCLTTEPPLLWGILLEELSPDSSSLLSLLQNFGDAPKGKSRPGIKLIKQTLAKWQQGTCSQPQTIDFALECLAVAHLLPRIAEELSSDAWWGLLDALWQVVQSSAGWRIDIELPPQEGLAQQLLAGELPLTLAYLLPEMRPVHKLHDAAHEALSEGVAELLNGEGLLRGTHLGVFRPLLACWTRCRTLGQVYKKKCWNQKAEDQFSCLATHAVALSSPAGAPMLGHPHAMPWTLDFLQNVLRWGGDGADIAAARYLFGKKLTRSLPQKRSKFVPETSDHCEWSGLAYLRTDWGRSEPTIVVDFSTPIMRIECWAGPQRLLSGTWTSETTLDGKRLEPVGTWDEVCWFSDEDVDYLELSIDLAGGATLERQILLAREELFLLLCDNVVGTRGGQLSHHYCLPLDANVAFEPCKETREGLLTAEKEKTIARVLPLALPEWRVDPRVGELSAADGQLQLAQVLPGRSLACPLLIDLNKPRARKECTWRQLTVAQSLEVQPHDVAVGYRAQCGKDQWLFYRSLDQPANRTVLGQNLSLDCLVARFLAASGEVDELLEIEGTVE